MEEYKYITFDNNDIIEALEDFYAKKNNEKIDIRFLEDNISGLISIRSITIKKPMSLSTAEFVSTSNSSHQSSKVGVDMGYGSEIGEEAKIPASTSWISGTMTAKSLHP
jgi:hypothetical protein